MWSANLDKVLNEQVSGKLKAIVMVTFTDGARKAQETFEFNSGTRVQVDTAIQGRLNDLNSVDTLKLDIPLGPFVPLAATPPDSARVAFTADLLLFTQMTHAIAVGVKTNGDKDYTDTVGRLKTNFLSSYIDLF